MNNPHTSYEDAVKKSPDYDEDGFNSYLDYQYESYPYGKKEDEGEI